MKKVVKWFLFSLVVLGGLALAICYMVIPERTKSAVDIVIGYLNTPLGIVGGTTITLGMVALVIGKYIIKLHREKLTLDYNNFKLDVNDYLVEVETRLEEAESYCYKLKTQIDKLKEAHNLTVNSNTEILKLIPNKKVQAKVEEVYGAREETTND